MEETAVPCVGLLGEVPQVPSFDKAVEWERWCDQLLVIFEQQSIGTVEPDDADHGPAELTHLEYVAVARCLSCVEIGIAPRANRQRRQRAGRQSGGHAETGPDSPEKIGAGASRENGGDAQPARFPQRQRSYRS